VAVGSAGGASARTGLPTGPVSSRRRYRDGATEVSSTLLQRATFDTLRFWRERPASAIAGTSFRAPPSMEPRAMSVLLRAESTHGAAPLLARLLQALT